MNLLCDLEELELKELSDEEAKAVIGGNAQPTPAPGPTTAEPIPYHYPYIYLNV